jgi:hypothetical protein
VRATSLPPLGKVHDDLPIFELSLDPLANKQNLSTEMNSLLTGSFC